MFLESICCFKTALKLFFEKWLETVLYKIKCPSHMKGCCAITVLTEIKHFLCEEENWKGFAKVSSIERDVCLFLKNLVLDEGVGTVLEQIEQLVYVLATQFQV